MARGQSMCPLSKISGEANAPLKEGKRRRSDEIEEFAKKVIREAG